MEQCHCSSQTSPKDVSGKYEVQKWSRHGYRSMAVLHKFETAQAELHRLLDSRNWWGLPPRIIERKDNDSAKSRDGD